MEKMCGSVGAAAPFRGAYLLEEAKDCATHPMPGCGHKGFSLRRRHPVLPPPTQRLWQPGPQLRPPQTPHSALAAWPAFLRRWEPDSGAAQATHMPRSGSGVGGSLGGEQQRRAK